MVFIKLVNPSVNVFNILWFSNSTYSPSRPNPGIFCARLMIVLMVWKYQTSNRLLICLLSRILLMQTLHVLERFSYRSIVNLQPDIVWPRKKLQDCLNHSVFLTSGLKAMINEHTYHSFTRRIFHFEVRGRKHWQGESTFTEGWYTACQGCHFRSLWVPISNSHPFLRRRHFSTWYIWILVFSRRSVPQSIGFRYLTIS